MPLQKKVIPVTMHGGMDAGTDPHLTASPIRIENYHIERNGALVPRRDLNIDRTFASNDDAAYMIFEHQGDAVILGNDGAYLADDAISSASVGTWLAGEVDFKRPRLTSIAGNNVYSVMTDGDVMAVAYQVSTGTGTGRIDIVDLPTMRVTSTLSFTDVGGGSRIRLYLEDSEGTPTIYWAYLTNDATAELAYGTIASATPVGSPAITNAIASTFVSGSPHAPTFAETASGIIVGCSYWNNSVARQEIAFVSGSSVLATRSAGTSLTLGSIFSFHPDASGTTFGFSYYDGTNVQAEEVTASTGAAAYSTTLGAHSGVTYITGVGSTDSNTNFSYYTYVTFDSSGKQVTQYHWGNGATTASTNKKQFAVIGPPMNTGSVGNGDSNISHYTPISPWLDSDSLGQRSLQLVDRNMDVVAHLTNNVPQDQDPDFCYGGTAFLNTLGTDKLLISTHNLLTYRADDDLTEIIPTMVEVSLMNPSLMTNPDIVPTGDAVYIGGLIPKIYDGELFAPGFPTVPALNHTGNLAGSNFTAGTYIYRAVLEGYDGHGRLYRSGTSETESVTLGGAFGTIQLDITVPYIPSPPSRLTVAVYRTTNGGSTYYLDGRQVFDSTTPISPGSVVSYDSTKTDANLILGETLYTTGGIVDNTFPRPFKIATMHQERIFYVDPENPSDTVYYSKLRVLETGLEFSNLLSVSIPALGGEITALASFLDKLVVFKKERIYIVEGEGFTNNLLGQNYQTAYEISSSLGCTNNTSVVVQPQGVMFLYRDVIYLLERNLLINPAPGYKAYHKTRKSTFGAGEIIKRAVNYEARESVAFFTSSSMLLYNWRHSAWTQYDSTFYASRDGTVADGVLVFISSDVNSTIYRELPALTAYNDAPGEIVLGFASPAGLGAIARIYSIIVYGYKVGSTSDIDAYIRYDNEPTWIQLASAPSASYANFDYSEHHSNSSAIVEGSSVIAKFYTDRTLMTNFSLRLAPELNYAITALAFEVGTQTQAHHVGATRRH